MDHDSGTYCSGSDGFQSTSPGGSDNSRDSNPSIIPPYTSAHPPNTQLPPFYSTPLTNRLYNQSYQQNNINTFNPLTPPSFEPMPSPKTQQNYGNSDGRESGNTTLTPCTTPPLEGASAPSLESEDPAEDHLRRLQMAFERNEMLPSPKDDLRDSAAEEDKSDYESEEVDELGVRIPRVNCHGKVKTFKCKQCEFIAVTKLEFWEHSKGHIKAEKLLTCPKCPFVTEYKHHLEYHLRNHFGSKPYKCDKCNYSCVNKSMLNSHLKSHSNVYQYRCSDCAYATKYCHSLKLHLRKYKHSPAMVLNADGTPNPLPIIDVYGTRRGPKQKKDQNDSLNSTSPTSHLNQTPMFNPFFVNSPPSTGLPLPFPYNHFLGAFSNPLLFPPMQCTNPVSPNPSYDRSTPESLQIEEPVPEEMQQKDDSSIALDLSKPEVVLPITVPVPEVAQVKNRRKGRAFKLERVAAPSPTEEEKDETIKDNNNIATKDIFNCQYCDIIFKDVVMYTMHMGYHGYKDPFTCNMCGEQSLDKVSFFLHIARTSHS